MTLHISESLIRLSNWIDDTFFPVPVEKAETKNDCPHSAAMIEIEQAANRIRRQIPQCTNLSQTYALLNLTVNFRLLFGNTTQVVAATDSLHLEIYHQQYKIIDKL